jgi:hypothetical protein
MVQPVTCYAPGQVILAPYISGLVEPKPSSIIKMGYALELETIPGRSLIWTGMWRRSPCSPVLRKGKGEKLRRLVHSGEARTQPWGKAPGSLVLPSTVQRVHQTRDSKNGMKWANNPRCAGRQIFARSVCAPAYFARKQQAPTTSPVVTGG